jgi:RNA polymerase sigma factor (sigma-70 family)
MYSDLITMSDTDSANHGGNDSIVPGEQWFATTQWTTVLMARDEQSPKAVEALEQLCHRYWPPIYAFIRRRGRRPEEAQDLTQEFFARLLEKKYLEAADPSKGRFRTLLLTAVSRFLINEHERAQAQKRGGGAVHFSLEAETAEDGYRFEPADPATPETVYERRWAETVLESVLARLRGEFERAGEVGRFEVLKPFLAAEKQTHSGAEVAVRLGITESAVYSAVHRLRQRYGELLREEVAHTVADPQEIDEELRHLVRALSQ